jgi:hypothetical protein
VLAGGLGIIGLLLIEAVLRTTPGIGQALSSIIALER